MCRTMCARGSKGRTPLRLVPPVHLLFDHPPLTMSQFTTDTSRVKWLSNLKTSFDVDEEKRFTRKVSAQSPSGALGLPRTFWLTSMAPIPDCDYRDDWCARCPDVLDRLLSRTTRLGPKTNSVEKLTALREAGMNIGAHHRSQSERRLNPGRKCG